jgi:hypothetical protein
LLHARADGIQQGFVEFGQAQARVAQQHHGGQAFAAHQIVEHDALPALLVGAGDGSVAIAGQVGQHSIGHALLAQRKQVDVLGAAGLLGSESQLLLLGQMAVDLPALERPTKAISGTSTLGSWLSWAAVVKKRAVHQPIASLLSIKESVFPAVVSGEAWVMTVTISGRPIVEFDGFALSTIDPAP